MNSIFFDAKELEPEYQFKCFELNQKSFLVLIKRKGVKGYIGTLQRTVEDAVLYMDWMREYLIK